MPWDYISMTFLMLTGVFLMFVVLLQRGRGGGLAGAFGGAGGQSAFGTKAGDVFTKITVVIAVVWVVLAAASAFALRAGAERHGKQFGPKEPAVTATDEVPEDAAPDEDQPEGAPAGGKNGAQDESEQTGSGKTPGDTNTPTNTDADDKSDGEQSRKSSTSPE